MKVLRAIGVGVLFWMLIFIEISVSMIWLKLSNLLTYIIHYVLMLPITFLCAAIYYKPQDKINGFLLGLFMVLVGIVFDCIITVPLFIIPLGGSYLTYFFELYLIVGLVEGIVLFGIYDLIRKK
jgi:hypothetical protein